MPGHPASPSHCPQSAIKGRHLRAGAFAWASYVNMQVICFPLAIEFAKLGECDSGVLMDKWFLQNGAARSSSEMDQGGRFCIRTWIWGFSCVPVRASASFAAQKINMFPLVFKLTIWGTGELWSPLCSHSLSEAT